MKKLLAGVAALSIGLTASACEMSRKERQDTTFQVQKDGFTAGSFNTETVGNEIYGWLTLNGCTFNDVTAETTNSAGVIIDIGHYAITLSDRSVGYAVEPVIKIHAEAAAELVAQAPDLASCAAGNSTEVYPYHVTD
jgi:hypothetical protein